MGVIAIFVVFGLLIIISGVYLLVKSGFSIDTDLSPGETFVVLFGNTKFVFGISIIFMGLMFLTRFFLLRIFNVSTWLADALFYTSGLVYLLLTIVHIIVSRKTTKR